MKFHFVSVRRIFVLLVTIGLFLTSCNDLEKPVFDQFENVKIHEISTEFVTLKGNAAFLNPGKQGYNVRSIDLEVFYEGKNIAEVNSTSATKVGGGKEFKIPFQVKLPMDELKKNLLSNLLGILKGKEVSLTFTGNLKLGKYGFSRKIPVNHQESIKIRM